MDTAKGKNEWNALSMSLKYYCANLHMWEEEEAANALLLSVYHDNQLFSVPKSVKAQKLSLMCKTRCMCLYDILCYNTQCYCIQALRHLLWDHFIFCLKTKYMLAGSIQKVQKQLK